MLRSKNSGFPTLVVAGLGVLAAAGAAALAHGVARDTPAQQRNQFAPRPGRIAGHVLGADGRPLTRALVRVVAPELPGGRNALTDNSGAFEFIELPAGRYTLTASKTGYVGLSYGQRRPLQAGTPLQLGDGQELKGVEFRLPRGSVITGHVSDETGDPLPGATVRVMRYQYAQGARQLVPAGAGQTDDRGEYRVWGLNPGEYFVSAIPRNPIGAGGRGFLAAAGGAGRGGPIPMLRGGPPPGADGRDPLEQEAYAPTYYPGVPAVHEARGVTVGLAAEIAGIDFNVLRVRTSRISGRVTNPDGSPAAAGIVNLLPEGVGGPGGMRLNYGSRIQGDGTFSIVNVPPGRYSLRARGELPRGRDGSGGAPQFASLPLTINDNITDLSITLLPGATITGMVTLQATQSAELPQMNQFRISASLVDPAVMGANPIARANQDGSFTLEGVPAGTLWIRAQAPSGWSLTSVVVGRQDATDAPFEVRSGDRITGVNLLFTDRQSEISGIVTDVQGAPATEFTVLAFPVDSALWRPQARQIMTARPDQTGKFQLRGLPPGDYFLTTIDPVEQGEWFEPAFLEQHRAGATRVRLGEGDLRTQDLRVVGR